MQDIINSKFGKWTVISYEGKRDTLRHWYSVICECGNKSIVERNILKRGKTTRCRSCARRGTASGSKNPSHKHGYSSVSHPHFKIYTTWCSMKARCYRKNDNNYHRYGGRGISVCDSWKNSFQSFLSDMGIPESEYSLDRIDVNGHYCKENCRWANKETQANNTRTTIYYELFGFRLSETQWSRKLGISRGKFYHWARCKGIQWVFENLEYIRGIKKGMSDLEYLKNGVELPKRRSTK